MNLSIVKTGTGIVNELGSKGEGVVKPADARLKQELKRWLYDFVASLNDSSSLTKRFNRSRGSQLEPIAKSTLFMIPVLERMEERLKNPQAEAEKFLSRLWNLEYTKVKDGDTGKLRHWLNYRIGEIFEKKVPQGKWEKRIDKIVDTLNIIVKDSLVNPATAAAGLNRKKSDKLTKFKGRASGKGTTPVAPVETTAGKPVRMRGRSKAVSGKGSRPTGPVSNSGDVGGRAATNRSIHRPKARWNGIKNIQKLLKMFGI
ncbi:MAG: hypothetical protein ABIH00_09080 [Armatimonadota bacterium]